MNFNEAELNFITKEFQKENENISKKEKLIDNIYKNKNELKFDILDIINNFKNDKKSVLLCIIYLGNIQNEFKYQAKQFWNDVSKLKEFYVVFQKIKPLKLRSIWEKIKQSKKVPIITEIIQKDKNIINESYGVNLSSIVNLLIKISKVELNLNNRIEKIKQELKKLSKGKKNKLIKKKENQNYENIQNAFKVNNKINLDINLKQIKKKLIDKNSKSKILNYSLFTNDNNKEEFDLITSAIQSLGNYFKDISKDEILNVLHSTSLNPGHAYLQLKYPNKTLYNFLESEDYIIRYMKNTFLYDELVLQKGENLIKEREKYLNLTD